MVDRAGREYLDVPYAEKDDAKVLGARWDPQAKRWFDPWPPSPGLERWAARSDVPDLLPGEDRSFGSGLFVDLVPRSCWFTNVRTCISQQDWERLRRMITRRAGYVCEICGAAEDRDRKLWLEAHERWHYDEQTRMQSLRRLICLCSSCHLVTHFGYANIQGRTDEAFAHLRKVTGMSEVESRRHVYAAEDLWIERSARTWTLDLVMLTDAGVTLARPAAAEWRPAAAGRAMGEIRSQPPAVPPQRRSTSPKLSVSGPVEQVLPPGLRAAAQPSAKESRSWWRRIVGGA